MVMNEWKRRTFLVLEPDVLVASDLREILLEFDPEAAVLVVRRAQDARAVIEGRRGLAAAFLRVSSRDPSRGELARAVEWQGGRVVMLDMAAGGDAPGWFHTGRPYGADAIADVLARMDLQPGPVMTP